MRLILGMVLGASLLFGAQFCRAWYSHSQLGDPVADWNGCSEWRDVIHFDEMSWSFTQTGWKCADPDWPYQR